MAVESMLRYYGSCICGMFRSIHLVCVYIKLYITLLQSLIHLVCVYIQLLHSLIHLFKIVLKTVDAVCCC